MKEYGITHSGHPGERPGGPLPLNYGRMTMSNPTTLQYEGSLRCAAPWGGPQATLHTDAPADHGGQGEYGSPTDLVAVALGTCAMTMVAVVGERSGLNLKGMYVEISKEMAAQPVRRVGSIHLVVHMPAGQQYPEPIQKKLEAAFSGCPVKNSLHPEIQVSHEFVYPSA
jgi:uncharacterized OsmC-like protein